MKGEIHTLLGICGVKKLNPGRVEVHIKKVDKTRGDQKDHMAKLGLNTL